MAPPIRTRTTGHNGIGRLTQITDPSGTTSYAYDLQGRILTETRVIGGTSYVTGYQYNAAGQRIAMTYPSGHVVGYSLRPRQPDCCPDARWPAASQRYRLSALWRCGRLDQRAHFHRNLRFRPPENSWRLYEPDFDFLDEFFGRFSTPNSLLREP